MMWVIREHGGMWQVGYYKPNGKWYTHFEHDVSYIAEKYVNYLNGGWFGKTHMMEVPVGVTGDEAAQVASNVLRTMKEKKKDTRKRARKDAIRDIKKAVGE